MTIQITYCRPCRFWGQALQDARALFEQFNQQIDQLKLIAGEDGVYDVKVDDELVFSKDEQGRFPDEGELIRILAERPGQSGSTAS